MHHPSRRLARGRWIGLGSLAILVGTLTLPNEGTPGNQEPRRPRQCIAMVDSLRADARRAFEREQARDSLSGAAYANYTKALQTAYQHGKECADRFQIATVADSLLGDLADLYMMTGQTDLARAAIDASLERGSPATRLDRVITAIRFFASNPYKQPAPSIDSLAQEVTGSPSATPVQRLAATAYLWKAMSVTAAPYPDTSRRIVRLGTAILGTAAPLDSASLAPYARIVANVPRRLARAYADLGIVDSAIRILNALKQTDTSTWTRTAIDREVEAIRLIGTPASALEPAVWLNAPDGGKRLDFKGQTTVLMFVAHYCGHCGYTYPLLPAILEDYQEQNVRLIMVTKTFGVFGEEEGLSFANELERDQEFYLRRHQITVPIAVYRGQPQSAKKVYENTSRTEVEKNFAVYDYGNATFVVIDSRGIIRNIRNDAYGAIARSNVAGAIASAREPARR